MSIHHLPAVNASLNAAATVMLIAGYVAVRRTKLEAHKWFMIAALVLSAVFLVSYVTHYLHVGTTPYPRQDWTRPLYFLILIPHIILATAMVPFILAAVWHAWREQFDKHVRLTRYVWPVWMYVSVTGVIVFYMLRIL